MYFVNDDLGVLFSLKSQEGLMSLEKAFQDLYEEALALAEEFDGQAFLMLKECNSTRKSSTIIHHYHQVEEAAKQFNAIVAKLPAYQISEEANRALSRHQAALITALKPKTYVHLMDLQRGALFLNQELDGLKIVTGQ